MTTTKKPDRDDEDQRGAADLTAGGHEFTGETTAREVDDEPVRSKRRSSK